MSLNPIDHDLPSVVTKNGQAYRVRLEQMDLEKLVENDATQRAAILRLETENAELRRQAAHRAETKRALDKLAEFTIALGEGRVSIPGVNDPANMTQGIVEAIVDPTQYRGAGLPVDPLKRFGVEIKPAASIPVGRAKRSDA